MLCKWLACLEHATKQTLAFESEDEVGVTHLLASSGLAVLVISIRVVLDVAEAPVCAASQLRP